jgi:hypothetical protein
VSPAKLCQVDVLHKPGSTITDANRQIGVREVTFYLTISAMNPEDFTRAVRGRVLARKNFNKLFCVGFNKTGTTTLELVLKLYGFNLPNQQEQEMRLTEQCFATNYSESVSFVNSYEAFQNLPFSQGLTFVVADSLFPNSKFVLTERDPESWFRSLATFHPKVFKLDVFSELSEQDVLEKLEWGCPS